MEELPEGFFVQAQFPDLTDEQAQFVQELAHLIGEGGIPRFARMVLAGSPLPQTILENPKEYARRLAMLWRDVPSFSEFGSVMAVISFASRREG